MLLIIVYNFTKENFFLGELLTTAIIYPFKSKRESEAVNVLVNLVQKYRSLWSLTHSTYGTKYSKMDQLKVVQYSLLNIRSDCGLSKQIIWPKFFKGCIPQILIDPSINTLPHMQQLLKKA